jgi:hypothetical protein
VSVLRLLYNSSLFSRKMRIPHAPRPHPSMHELNASGGILLHYFVADVSGTGAIVIWTLNLLDDHLQLAR